MVHCSYGQSQTSQLTVTAVLPNYLLPSIYLVSQVAQMYRIWKKRGWGALRSYYHSALEKYILLNAVSTATELSAGTL